MTAAAQKKEVTIGGAVGVPPAGAVALRSLTMRNVLSFGAEATVELGALNVLIGANGCGKSNLMDVIALLKAAADGDLSDEFRGGAEDWVRNGVEKDKHGARTMRIISRWAGKEGEFTHSIGIRVGNGKYYIYSTEDICWKEFPPRSSSVEGEKSARFPAQSMLAEMGLDEIRIEREDHADFLSLGLDHYRMSLLNPAVPIYHGVRKENVAKAAGICRRELSDIIKDVQIYRCRPTGRTGELNPLHLPARTDKPIDRLSETLDNFALVLNRVRLEREDDMMESLRQVYGNARGLDVKIGHNLAEVILKEKGGNIPAHRMSDGTLHWLFLLTVLLDPNPPALVCIDEPETGLHPDMFSVLAKLLIDASKRMQLIVATHARGIVDMLTDMPESVVVCDKTRDNVTSMRRLSAEDLRGWEDEGLGMAWASGAIGGARW